MDFHPRHDTSTSLEVSVATPVSGVPVQDTGPRCPHTAHGTTGQTRMHQEPLAQRHERFADAEAYVRPYHHERGTPEHGMAEAVLARLSAIHEEIAQTGSYRHTRDELEYGAKVAWRNNSQCIGKFYWQNLTVRDLRQLSSAEAVYEALVEHLTLATNGGKVRLMLTVFAAQQPGQPGIRIWNAQLVRYAGYRQADGSVIGDAGSVAFTELVRALGWQGGEGTPFDLLPLVIQMPGGPPKLFELPREAVLEVPLHHPDYAWFADLGLKWYAHPAISNTRLEIGGVSYTAAPFSAWYTCTEIGARNLSDTNRYNMLPVVAQKMGLDTRSDRTPWKDRALLELTAAVLHSFRAHGVSILDHHAVTRQFVIHGERETQAGRITPAQWSLIIPPMSASTTPVFQRSYQNILLKPNFFSQPEPWQESAVPLGCPLH